MGVRACSARLLSTPAVRTCRLPSAPGRRPSPHGLACCHIFLFGSCRVQLHRAAGAGQHPHRVCIQRHGAHGGGVCSQPGHAHAGGLWGACVSSSSLRAGWCVRANVWPLMPQCRMGHASSRRPAPALPPSAGGHPPGLPGRPGGGHHKLRLILHVRAGTVVRLHPHRGGAVHGWARGSTGV